MGMVWDFYYLGFPLEESRDLQSLLGMKSLEMMLGEMLRATRERISPRLSPMHRPKLVEEKD